MAYRELQVKYYFEKHNWIKFISREALLFVVSYSATRPKTPSQTSTAKKSGNHGTGSFRVRDQGKE